MRKVSTHRPGLPIEAVAAANAAWGADSIDSSLKSGPRINALLSESIQRDTISGLKEIDSTRPAPQLKNLIFQLDRCDRFGVDTSVTETETGQNLRLRRTCQGALCRHCHARRILPVIRQLRDAWGDSTATYAEWTVPAGDPCSAAHALRKKLKDRLARTLRVPALLTVRLRPHRDDTGWDVVAGVICPTSTPPDLFPGILPAKSLTAANVLELVPTAFRFWDVSQSASFMADAMGTLKILRGHHCGRFVTPATKKESV